MEKIVRINEQSFPKGIEISFVKEYCKLIEDKMQQCIKGERIYIENKYWNHYIGDTDDSLTLVEYLAEKQREEMPLTLSWTLPLCCWSVK